ncbi:hypothetical protein B0H11DRAFT_2067686 [Mycena galericulata]|nr:hypothetical protein B0H11DRAFT_2067686 [Mycena galericulata]
MADLDFLLFAIIHHTVSSTNLRLTISGDMISEQIWTEAFAASEGQVEQLRVMGNWALHSSLVHHVLPVIPFQSQSFFDVSHRFILHPNVYTQFFLKTGIYSAEEDRFDVAEDQVASGAFILLCALLLKTSGPNAFLAWFWDHFHSLFVALEQAIDTYMTYGGRFLVDQNQHYFVRAPAIYTRKMSHVGIPDGPPLFKSLALLRILRERLTPPVLPCTPSVLVVTQPPPPALPSPALFATTSTLEKEHSLRSQLISRRKPDHNKPIHKADVQDTCQPKNCRRVIGRPLSDVANLPLRSRH